MTELEFIEGRILHHERRLKKAEWTYHRAVTYGDLHDRQSALAECQATRAKLLEYLHRRDELTGGARNGEKD